MGKRRVPLHSASHTSLALIPAPSLPLQCSSDPTPPCSGSPTAPLAPHLASATLWGLLPVGALTRPATQDPGFLEILVGFWLPFLAKPDPSAPGHSHLPPRPGLLPPFQRSEA